MSSDETFRWARFDCGLREPIDGENRYVESKCCRERPESGEYRVLLLNRAVCSSECLKKLCVSQCSRFGFETMRDYFN